MIEYPKIETLYDRDETNKISIDKIRCPEFSLIKEWHVTEKIDGTNIRIGISPDRKEVVLGGRTEAAQLQAGIVSYFQQNFLFKNWAEIFDPNEYEVTLFGEGYGPKIQKGGSYRNDISFRLFDIRIGKWWLEWPQVEELAQKIGIKTAPSLENINYLPKSYAELKWMFPSTHNSETRSLVAVDDEGTGCMPEGVVARTVPLLYNKAGQRVMWKLKFKDF